MDNDDIDWKFFIGGTATSNVAPIGKEVNMSLENLMSSVAKLEAIDHTRITTRIECDVKYLSQLKKISKGVAYHGEPADALFGIDIHVAHFLPPGVNAIFKNKDGAIIGVIDSTGKYRALPPIQITEELKYANLSRPR